MAEPRDEVQTEVHTLVLMDKTLRSEIDRRAAREGDEGMSSSKFVRMVLREYFGRHPLPEKMPAEAPSGTERKFLYISRLLYVEVDRRRRFARCTAGRLIRAALQDYFRRHPE